MRVTGVCFLAVIIVGSIVGSPAKAAQIDFETDASGEELVAPVGFGNVTALRDRYLPRGVRFDGPASNNGGVLVNALTSFDIQARSGNNILLFHNTPGILADGGSAFGPETIIFDPPITSFSIHATAGSSQGVFIIQGFTANGGLVGIGQTFSNANQYAMLNVSVSAGNEIERVRITASGVDRWGLDDLSFTPIPEPATAMMILIPGVFAVKRRGRVRRF